MADIVCQLPLWTQTESTPKRRKRRETYKPCAYPDCEALVSHKATHCRKHGAQIRANTPEGRKRMSKSAKAQTVNPFQGCTHSEATKQIIREKRALQVFSEESIKKNADAHRGNPNLGGRGRKIPAEENARRSATLLSKHDYLSEKGKERYANETEEQRERRLTNWIKAGQGIGGKDTSIEIFVAQYLDIRGIEYEYQKQIGYYFVDFYIPSLNLVVDVQGCYWHGCLKCGFNTPRHLAKRRYDQKRYFAITKLGYRVKSIWEHDIRKAMRDETYILHILD